LNLINIKEPRDLIVLWATIGMALAAREPEFGRGRGRPAEMDWFRLVIDIIQVNDWSKKTQSVPVLSRRLCKQYPERYGKYSGQKIPTLEKYVRAWRSAAVHIAFYAHRDSTDPNWETEVASHFTAAQANMKLREELESGKK
jgi:hypothetical protein